MDYVIVALFQLAFSILKVFDVKWSYDNDITKLVLGNFALSAVWLASTAIGIVGVMDGDWFMIFVYVFFGGIGKAIAIIYFDPKYRSKDPPIDKKIPK